MEQQIQIRPLLILLVLALLLISHNINAGIGTVINHKGNASITRDKTVIESKKDVSIESLDIVETGKGEVGISFDDDTQVKVTDNSKLVIDDFVYDPNNKSVGKLALKCAIGTVRYASGNIAHANNKNVAINTPTATIAVRGTAFTMTVDEIGQSMVILLPNLDGSVGEIEVRTAVGSVVLNQAFQATVTTSNEIKPLKPVVLLINESAITNMMIVKPPKEITQKLIEDNKSGSSLDFNGLDKDALSVRVFIDPYAKFNELDVDALLIEYLANALEDAFAVGTFAPGYNSQNQVYIFDKQTNWMVQRSVKHSATLLLNKDRGYNITLVQDGTTVKLQSADTTTNKIFIKQGAN
jgi:hypothetical protein